jgi:DNA-binding winged helix-turn-helix (wHTH) protein/tetratricopeptide (TPR) repeat protein
MALMLIEFGPFVADTDRRELLKYGKRLRLRAQPFDILVALMERAGETVTRDELRRRLWSDQTFVEFETGLNSAVSRLREVLGDTAQAPCLIETVPKQGYRFVGPVSLKVKREIEATLPQQQTSEAHQAYLKGHHLIKRHTPPNARRGLEYFTEAIRLDPNDALNYHGAALYYLLATLMGELPPWQALPQAEDFVSRGMLLKEDSAMLQNTLAVMRMYQWRWNESRDAFHRAISLEPANPHVRMMYSNFCSWCGRHDDALQQAQMAVELDLLDPMTNFHFVKNSYYARQYEQAVERGRAAIELTRDFPYTRWYVSWSLIELGNKEGAWSLANEARALGGRQPTTEGHFGYVAGASGHEAEAREVLRELEARSERGYFPALAIAWTHLGLGQTEACLARLRHAVLQKEPYLPSIAVSPACDPLRARSEFTEIMRQIGSVSV